ncbi:MAG TPA: LysR substrate-binding domain-containing protein [Burkholderiales bacterium]|nr:LysR substrate-binding domain-containing protein [Burkholderiales bacterium]
MDLKQLDYFVHVADASSFSKAAQLLSVAQPALSRQIRTLEVELRQTLFLRNGRGVTLTPPGARLLSHARGILQQVARVRAELDESRTAPVGRVALGVPPSVGRVLSGPLVAEFRARFPRADISIAEGLTVHILEWLALGRVDVGVVYNPPVSTAIELRPFVEQHLFLIGPKRARPDDHAATVGLRQLPGYPLIIPSRPHTIRMLVDSRLSALNLKPTVALEIDGVRAILDLVQRGHGYAVLPRHALIEAGPSARLAARPIVHPALRSVMAVATSAQRPLTGMAQETIGLLQSIGPPLLKG